MATDLRQVLVDNIKQDLDINLTAGFISPRSPQGLVLTRLPGSHVLEEDYEGTQDVLYNFEITAQVTYGEHSALKEAQDKLFQISDYLESLTDLKPLSGKQDYQFIGLEVQSAPAELTIDLKKVQCGLEIGVTVMKNRYRKGE